MDRGLELTEATGRFRCLGGHFMIVRRSAAAINVWILREPYLRRVAVPIWPQTLILSYAFNRDQGKRYAPS